VSKKFSIFTIFAIAVVCVAADYGRFLCNSCAMPMSPPDARAFISVFVNPKVPAWSANDTVSVCNGKVCVKYMTPSPNAVAWSVVSVTPDPRTGYVATGENITGYDYGDGRFGIQLWAPMVDLIAAGWGSLFDRDGYVFVEPMCTCEREYDEKIGACG
jgi:hypothetical protein